MIKVNGIEQYSFDNKDGNKIRSLEDISYITKRLHERNKSVGLCHGGFDLVHPGHVKHFESAKKLCDVLVVSITSDNFVSSRKGNGRPIYPEQLRAYMIASIEYVDYVVISDFKSGIEVIEKIRPYFYIKGEDYINKETPGIKAEREAIKKIGGSILYTKDPKMSATEIIDYIKEMDQEEILIGIDRDGTLITNNDFPGQEDDWKDRIIFNDEVINFLSYLQKKTNNTTLVVSNQAGVARGFIKEGRVREMNSFIDEHLKKIGIKIDDWEYCPDVDVSYANNSDYPFICRYVKNSTKRKPSIAMVKDGLKKVDKKLKKFSKIVIIGDRHEDEGLAKNLDAKFIDVKDKSFKDMVTEYENENIINPTKIQSK